MASAAPGRTMRTTTAGSKSWAAPPLRRAAMAKAAPARAEPPKSAIVTLEAVAALSHAGARERELFLRRLGHVEAHVLGTHVRTPTLV